MASLLVDETAPFATSVITLGALLMPCLALNLPAVASQSRASPSDVLNDVLMAARASPTLV